MKHQGFLSTSDKPHYENVPFEVPSSWVWTTVGDIAESNIGLTYKPSDICDDGVPVYRSNNIQNRRIDKTELVRVNAKILDKQYLAVGDLLICARNGSRRLVGKCALIENLSEPSAFGAFMAVCRSAYNPWIYLLLNTGYFNRYLDDSNSTAINQVTQSMLLAFRVPFPPKKEQDRIIYEISKWFDLIDTIEKSKEELQVIISTTKSKILDLAIHGKLVPQDPTDEPASELLKRINPKAEITSDNGHYQKLPKGWCETTLKHVITIKSGYPINVRNCMQGHYPIYGGNGITGYTVDHNIKEPTIVVGRVGFYCGSVYLVRGKAWVSDNAFITTIHKDIFYKKYLYYLIQFLNLRKYSNSTAQPVISGKTIYPIHVIIPPINEQHRIVSKIEEIFAQLDAIEASL